MCPVTCCASSLLDSILSLASAARLSKWTRPVITKEAELYIAGGRHPLQELCVSTCTQQYEARDTLLTHRSHSEQHVNVGGTRGYAEAHLRSQRLR